MRLSAPGVDETQYHVGKVLWSLQHSHMSRIRYQFQKSSRNCLQNYGKNM